MRLIDADALKYKNVAEVNGVLTHILTAEEIDNAPTITPCKDCDLYFKAMTIKAMQEAKRQNERI